jgi:hypothetical protein
MVLTVSFVLSPVNGLVATVPAQCKALSRVDASIAASGPHDFIVRLTARTSGAPQASIASRAQRVVTIAKRPSIGRETAAALKVICPTAKAENFGKTGWTLRKDQDSRTDLPVGQIPINIAAAGPRPAAASLGRELRR